MEDTSKGSFTTISALILLSAVPVGAGLYRLVSLSTGAGITPENARFFADPWPVVAHVIGVGVYCILGAFQVSSGFRQRRPAWHRTAGKILIPCGLVGALSGLWMTAFYPIPEGDRGLLAAFRYLFGSAWALFIVFGVIAIVRRDFARHGVWMLRAYAIAQGTGAQFVTLGSWSLLFGAPSDLPRALLMGASWVISLVAAEWIVRGRRWPRQGETECVSPMYS